MSNILVALDGSDRAEQAIEFALAYRRPDEHVVLLRVLEPFLTYPTLQPVQVDELVREAELRVIEYLQGLAGKLRDQGVQSQIRVTHGNPTDEILWTAEKEGSRMILMTSHGRTGLKRFLIGSTAERVCRKSLRPVCLIPLDCLKSERPPALQRILVPLDVSELAEHALQWLLELPVGERVTLFHAMDPLSDWQSERKDYLENQAALLRQKGWQVETEIGFGSPAEKILDKCDTSEVDAIVMTTHGLSNLEGWLAGSVAERVYRHSVRPVILINPQVFPATQLGSEEDRIVAK